MRIALILILLVVTPAYAELKKDTGKEIYRAKIGVEADEVIVGDEENPQTLKPKVKFTRWNKEEDLTIEYKGEEEFYTNALGDTFKFGLILNGKPTKNKFQFKLSGWENFKFLYQPPLKNTNPDGSTWEYNKHGGTSKRPADVNGSYAIYHKTKQNYIIGQTNYKSGKFGHIYRPKFIDKNGKWVWGNLHIENGIYEVTIPQDFLDKAEYPVKANDTFGTTGVGGSSNDSWGGDLVAYATSTPVFSGTLTKISIYCEEIKSGAKLYTAIYSDVTGTPTVRLASETTGVSMPGSFDWLDMPLSYAGITATTQYWLGHGCGTSGEGQYWYKFDTDGDWEQSVYTGGGGWQNPWVESFDEDMRGSIYATYTPAGWTHKINSVAAANMASVNTVAKADIAEVNQT